MAKRKQELYGVFYMEVKRNGKRTGEFVFVDSAVMLDDDDNFSGGPFTICAIAIAARLKQAHPGNYHFRPSIGTNPYRHDCFIPAHSDMFPCVFCGYVDSGEVG